MTDFNSSLPIRTENNGDVKIILVDGTTPTQVATVDASGNVHIKSTSAGPVTGGTVATTSTLAGGQYNATPLTLTDGQQAAVQVNAKGEIIVAQGDSSSNATGWWVRPGDGTNAQSYTAAGEAKVDITQPLPAGTNLIGEVKSRTEDGAGTAINSQALGGSQYLDVVEPSNGAPGTATPAYANLVGGTDGTDLRALKTLASGQLSVAVQDSTGAAITTTNPLPVVVSQNIPGTNVNKYNTTANLAAAGTTNHDYAITAAKTFTGKMFWASGSGKIRVDVQTSPDGTTFTTFWTGFNSTANPNVEVQLDLLSISNSGTGAKMRIVITNEDKAAFDVFSTISGVEN